MRAGTVKRMLKWNVLTAMLVAVVFWTAGSVMAAGEECGYDGTDGTSGCFAEGDAHGLTSGTIGDLGDDASNAMPSGDMEQDGIIDSLLSWMDEMLYGERM